MVMPAGRYIVASLVCGSAKGPKVLPTRSLSIIHLPQTRVFNGFCRYGDTRFNLDSHVVAAGFGWAAALGRWRR